MHTQYLTVKSNHATTSTFKRQSKIYHSTLQMRPQLSKMVNIYGIKLQEVGKRSPVSWEHHVSLAAFCFT